MIFIQQMDGLWSGNLLSSYYIEFIICNLSCHPSIIDHNQTNKAPPGPADDDVKEESDFEDFGPPTPKSVRRPSPPPEEKPEIVIVSGISWLRFKGKEVELPRVTGEWSLSRDGGVWTVTDGNRTKRVESLLLLERARVWLA